MEVNSAITVSPIQDCATCIRIESASEGKPSDGRVSIRSAVPSIYEPSLNFRFFAVGSRLTGLPITIGNGEKKVNDREV